MDDKDKKILKLLQSNGKMSYSEIGEAIELSITAVKERLKKLRHDQVLSNNVYLVNPESIGLDICAFVLVLMPVPAEELNFTKQINLVEEVLECHCITGEYSYLLKIRVKNTKMLEKLIGDKIKTIKGVVKTNTIISLTTSKEITQLKV